MMALPATSMAAPVLLGDASSFAVLAGTTITNTGPTVIGGTAGSNIGVSPGSSITGFPPGIVLPPGAIQPADPPAADAQIALTAAYDDAAGRGGTTSRPAELGGQTLTPGVYVPTSGDFQITGTLTLYSDDPDGVFVFKTPAFTTMSGSRVVLTGQAQYCRIFWQVTSSATLGTNSTFVGHLLAMQSISAASGARVQGQLLAREGAVTLDTNSITNGPCDYSSFVHIRKTALPVALTGPGSVTYRYEVTNLDTLPLTSVSVADDKLSPVTYVSGDLNTNSQLDPTETWIYTATTNLTATTTNVATVRATTSTGAVETDTAATTVVVSRTITGGELPKTGTPWYNLLLAGAALVLMGAAGYWSTTRKIHA